MIVGNYQSLNASGPTTNSIVYYYTYKSHIILLVAYSIAGLHMYIYKLPMLLLKKVVLNVFA